MKQFLTLAATLFAAAQILGQASNVANLGDKLDQIGNNSSVQVIPVFDKTVYEIEGSRYSAQDFNEGEIWMTEERHFTTQLKYRFDELENSIEVKYPDGRTLLLFNNQVEKCFIKLPDGRQLRYINASDFLAEKDLNRLLQVVYTSPKYKLIKNPKKEFKNGSREKTYRAAGTQNDAFIAAHTYFLQIEKGKFKEIKLTKKGFLKALPELKTKLDALFLTPQYAKELDDWKAAELLQSIEKQ